MGQMSRYDLDTHYKCFPQVPCQIILHRTVMYVCNRVAAANAPECTAAEGLLYKPWSLIVPTCTARCLHQRPYSTERRNYLGEKWSAIWTESCDFHAYTFRFFYMPQIRDMGQTALLPFRRKACWEFFRPEKIQRLRQGSNPRTWGTKGQHATSRPPKPLPTSHTNDHISV